MESVARQSFRTFTIVSAILGISWGAVLAHACLSVATDVDDVRRLASIDATNEVDAVPPQTRFTSIRLNGTVEPVELATVTVPSIVGENAQPLVLQRLQANGTMVRAGELIVQFDREQQLRAAREKHTEWLDLDAQLRKKRADLEAQAAKDQTEVEAAEVTLAIARLDLLKNDLLPTLDARKNVLNLETAQETLAELRNWFALARASDRAALRVLEIRRDRTALFVRQADANAERMAIRAPITGLAVLRTTWRAGGLNTIIEEGESLRPGTPVLDLVGPGPMRVRAYVNQVDASRLHVGQVASVRLDSNRDAIYRARLETISPVATTTGLSQSSDVRMFTAVFRLDKTSTSLTPELTAAVDVELGDAPSPMRGSQ